MPAIIPLHIGKDSSGNNFVADLLSMPNLFISYSSSDQLPEIFLSFLRVMNQPELKLALSLNSSLSREAGRLVSGEHVIGQFNHGECKDGDINSIGAFIKFLKKEAGIRKPLLKRDRSMIQAMPSVVIFIDNIFEIFAAKNRLPAINFLELLIEASSLKMYFILGSPGIYRGLLDEVIKVSPSLQRKAGAILSTSKISQILGAELVVNPDGLLFFREKEEKVHRRFYPV